MQFFGSVLGHVGVTHVLQHSPGLITDNVSGGQTSNVQTVSVQSTSVDIWVNIVCGIGILYLNM